jgi:hypothetical protein
MKITPLRSRVVAVVYAARADVPKTRPRVLRPGPSLQNLVASAGGYDRISDSEWAQYDAELASWLEDVRLDRAEAPE